MISLMKFLAFAIYMEKQLTKVVFLVFLVISGL